MAFQSRPRSVTEAAAIVSPAAIPKTSDRPAAGGARPPALCIFPAGYDARPVLPFAQVGALSDALRGLVMLNGAHPPALLRVAHLLPLRQLVELVRVSRGPEHLPPLLARLNAFLGDRGPARRGVHFGLLPAAGDPVFVSLPPEGNEQGLRLAVLEALSSHGAGTILCVDVRYLFWPTARRLCQSLRGGLGGLDLMIVTNLAMCVDVAVAVTDCPYPTDLIEGRRILRRPHLGSTIVSSQHTTPPELVLGATWIGRLARQLAGLRPAERAFVPDLMHRRYLAGRNGRRILFVDRGPYGGTLEPLIDGERHSFVDRLGGSVGGGFDPLDLDPWCVGHRGSVSIRVACAAPEQILAIGLRMPAGRAAGSRVVLVASTLLGGDQAELQLDTSGERDEFVIFVPLKFGAPFDILDLRLFFSKIRGPSSADEPDQRQLGGMLDVVDLWPMELEDLARAIHQRSMTSGLIAAHLSFLGDRAIMTTLLPSSDGIAVIDKGGRGGAIGIVGSASWLPTRRLEAEDSILLPAPRSAAVPLPLMLGHASHTLGLMVGEFVALSSAESALVIETVETVHLSAMLSVGFIGFHGHEPGDVRWSRAADGCYLVFQSTAQVGAARLRIRIPILRTPEGGRNAYVRTKLRGATVEAFTTDGRQIAQRRLLDDAAKPLRPSFDFDLPAAATITVRIMAPTINLAKLGLSTDERDLGILLGLPMSEVIDSQAASQE
jgi:hypothetical protein